jgi:hypothetical protein
MIITVKKRVIRIKKLKLKMQIRILLLKKIKH